MKEGDVVITPLPQADGQVKARPAVLLRTLPPFGDWLACGISSQLEQMAPNFDELIESPDSDFPGSGLKCPSLIRLGYLAVLPRAKIVGGIGSISRARHHRLLDRLSRFLAPPKR
jgi:mRNA interferase MazF